MSRCFGIKIGDGKLACLVPLADMGNHKIPYNTIWNYSNIDGGFIIQAIRDIKQGGEISLPYGHEISNYCWFY